MLHLASFSQDMRRRGLTPSTRSLGIERDRPPADVGARPRPRPQRQRPGGSSGCGSPTASRSRWSRAGTPSRCCPTSTATTSAARSTTLFRDGYGLGIDAAEQTLWGETADAALAKRLDAPLHTPLLVFRRISTAAGKPLEHVVSRYRGDRYQIHMSLGSGTTHGRQPDRERN